MDASAAVALIVSDVIRPSRISSAETARLPSALIPSLRLPNVDSMPTKLVKFNTRVDADDWSCKTTSFASTIEEIINLIVWLILMMQYPH